ncbi:MAG: hypothetical protein CUN53_02780 [Phototrophicales bacterium]|nr:MAG: hypothetical protein CUN53_02780 [Phototrophicales bacterium]
MNDELANQVQQYQQLVIRYEALDHEIDALIMAHGGTSDKMPADDFRRYRDLARERDELLNEMRFFEHQLNLDEDELS